MSRAITITIDATVPDEFYTLNEDNLLDDIQSAVDTELRKLLINYYANGKQAGMCVVQVAEIES